MSMAHTRKGVLLYKECVIEWLMLYAKSAIFQPFYGEKNVSFHAMMLMIARFVLEEHAWSDLYGVSSLKQQSADRHVVPLAHVILIPSKPVFALYP